MNISETGNPVNELISRYKINEDKVGPESEKKAANNLAPEEKVSLSSIAKDIVHAEKAIEQLPDVRAQKVQELKAQIETGKYNVNGEKIAEKMMSESLLDILA
jgi:negative regulator of flagellin synthesis FlgM